MAKRDIPVYLFMGFLEAGKTMFIQKTLSNPQFKAGRNVLLLVCEEGIEEYDTSKIKQSRVATKVIDDVSELTMKNLSDAAQDCSADCVVIEYNGMWQLNSLFDAMPDNWQIYQAIMIADASTILQYNTSFRSLVAEKINFCELVIFNRFENNAKMEDLHALVRSVSRQVAIYYEKDNGETITDNIIDPLPYDMESDHIVINDMDYAIWFFDMQDNPRPYDGKTVTFKAKITKMPRFPKELYAVGRDIMNCCAADMQFCWLPAEYDPNFRLKKVHWATVDAKIKIRHNDMYDQDFPTLRITKVSDTVPPDPEEASLY